MSDMEARLNKLETKQELTEARVNELDKNGALFKQALENFGAALDRFGKIAEKVEESMNKMDLRVTKIEQEVDCDTEDIETIKKTFEEHDKKQKLDIVDILRSEWKFIILLGYVILNHLGFIKF